MTLTHASDDSHPARRPRPAVPDGTVHPPALASPPLFLRIHRLFRWAILGFALVSPVGFLAIPASAESDGDRVRLQLRWHHKFQFAGYYAAEARGFFRDAGLTVEILEGKDGVDPVREVLEGRAEFGVGNSELVLHYLEGEPLVALASIFQHSPLVLMSRADEAIRTPRDLVGRRVKMLLAPRDAELMAMFQTEGISMNEIDVEQGWVHPEDFFRPDLAAISAYLTNEPYLLRSRGIEVRFLRPATYGIDFYGDTLFTRRELGTDAPDRTRRFRAACLRGWEYALAHPREIILLLMETYAAEKSYDHLRYEADTLRELIDPGIVPVGYMNPGRWKHIADTYVRLGMAKQSLPLDAFIYEDSSPGPPAWLVAVAWGAGAAAAAGIVFTAILMLFNQRLSRAVGERTRSLSRLNVRLLEEVQERRRAETALKGFQDALEERIQERTLELESANRRLREEVDQRRETEGALLENQAEKQAILDGITSLILFLDRRRRVRWANRSAARHFGREPEALVGIECRELWGAAASTCQICPTRKVLDTWTSERGVVRTQDGRLWDKRSEPVLDGGGRLVGVLEVSDDITERRRMETQLRHVRQMEAVGELAAGVAHEFNNALFGITGHVELLRQSADRADAVLRHSKQVLLAAERMIRLTDRLLAFARVGRFDLVPMPLNPFVERTAAPRGNGSENRARRELRLDATEDVVAADPHQLDRALSAILANAEESVKADGTIRMRTWNRTLETVPEPETPWIQPGAYFVISVSDTGHGMPAKVRDRVFEPFFSTKFRGRGLGLAAALGIVRNHRGWMELASEPNDGTQVHVFLPVAEIPAGDSSEKDASASAPPHPVRRGREFRAVRSPDACDDRTLRLFTGK